MGKVGIVFRMFTPNSVELYFFVWFFFSVFQFLTYFKHPSTRCVHTISIHLLKVQVTDCFQRFGKIGEVSDMQKLHKVKPKSFKLFELYRSTHALMCMRTYGLLYHKQVCDSSVYYTGT